MRENKKHEVALSASYIGRAGTTCVRRRSSCRFWWTCWNTNILYQSHYHHVHEEDLYHSVSNHNGWDSESNSTGDLMCHLYTRNVLETHQLIWHIMTHKPPGLPSRIPLQWMLNAASSSVTHARCKFLFVVVNIRTAQQIGGVFWWDVTYCFPLWSVILGFLSNVMPNVTPRRLPPRHSTCIKQTHITHDT
jgi:hypothetical protein